MADLSAAATTSEFALTLVQAFVEPASFVHVVGTGAVACALWWWRERRLRHHRRVLRGIMRASENLLDAPTPREILTRVRKQAPALVGATQVDLHLLEPSDDVLLQLPATDGEPAGRIAVDAPIGTFAGAAALCFRNRTLLRIPDARNSPILHSRDPKQPPSAVFVPMFAQGELLGVLAVYLSKKTLLSNPDQDVALQHLANQIAASLKLQEQRLIREQLVRTEKMAAAGQLISAVANDLRGPLESIGRTARSLARADMVDEELTDIAIQAHRGLDIIDHLLSFARMEQRDARPLDLHALASNLLEVRADEHLRKGVRIENELPVAPVIVLADQGQLEQAMLTVLVNAEAAAVSSPDRTLRVSSRIIGRKVLLSFDALRPALYADTAEMRDGTGFPVAQVIVQSHGGDLRHVVDGRHGARFEIQLPVHDPGTVPVETTRQTERPGRVLTCLLIEPEPASQRRLLSALAERGHRAIPAASAEQAADLVQRMRFDAVFCSSVLPGLNWLELYRRIRRRTGSFALLADTYDAETARFFERGEGALLIRPVGQRELGDFLAAAEGRLQPAQE
jgi:signal transduction histidine kinase/CheY-like chemotaxis protein